MGFFFQLQAANGSIIDKYAHEEIQYAVRGPRRTDRRGGASTSTPTRFAPSSVLRCPSPPPLRRQTPCYAFASATLVQTNVLPAGISSAALLNSSARAFTAAVTELQQANCAQGHCNFYTMPLMFALPVLAPLVAPSLAAQWNASLRGINPYVSYHGYLTNNWGIVALTGDFLRAQAGLNTNTSWYLDELALQLGENSFTQNGQYQDRTGYDGVLNPMPYDLFPRKYLAVMLAKGFSNATLTPYLWELSRRGAWVSLLEQSPKGELPTGGRSSQHQWNEAVQATLFELWASRLSRGDPATGVPPEPALACMFKRGAHLALMSVRRWQNPTGELQIVKNHFDPALRWGYEDYSFQSQYNLLPASMLAQAYLFANESVPECSTFADAGGFVFEEPEFHKVFANAAGTYVEIETGADPNYDAVGLTRIHVPGVTNALLGPTAGSPQGGVGLAIGPFWRLQGASYPGYDSLANASFKDVTNVTLEPLDSNGNASRVEFELTFLLDDRGLFVLLHVLVEPKLVTVTASVRPATPGPPPVFEDFGVLFPAFVFDGAHNTTVTVNPGGSNTATVTYDGDAWGRTTLSVPPPDASHRVTWTTDPKNLIQSRNGLLQPVFAHVSPIETAEPSITFTVSYE